MYTAPLANAGQPHPETPERFLVMPMNSGKFVSHMSVLPRTLQLHFIWPHVRCQMWLYRNVATGHGSWKQHEVHRNRANCSVLCSGFIPTQQSAAEASVLNLQARPSLGQTRIQTRLKCGQPHCTSLFHCLPLVGVPVQTTKNSPRGSKNAAKTRMFINCALANNWPHAKPESARYASRSLTM